MARDASLAAYNSVAACLNGNVAGHHSRKNAFPKSSLPTATLPKAMLLFSLLLPAVKLLMEIPSCSSPRAPP